MICEAQSLCASLMTSVAIVFLACSSIGFRFGRPSQYGCCLIGRVPGYISMQSETHFISPKWFNYICSLSWNVPRLSFVSHRPRCLKMQLLRATHFGSQIVRTDLQCSLRTIRSMDKGRALQVCSGTLGRVLEVSCLRALVEMF